MIVISTIDKTDFIHVFVWELILDLSFGNRVNTRYRFFEYKRMFLRFLSLVADIIVNLH